MVPPVETDVQFDRRFTKALQSVGLTVGSKPEDPTEILETVEPDTVKDKVAAADLKSPTPINLFQHPDAHPLALDLALLRRYGPEWLTWEAETLEIRIPMDFKTKSLAALNFEKIMAVKTLHLTTSFWRHWDIFSSCVGPLNGQFPDFEVMQAPTYGEVVVAADIANRIRTDVTWSEEVTRYIEVVMRHDGVVVGIEPLQNIEPDVTGYPIDTAMIKAAWPAVHQTGRAPDDATVEAEQLRRMLAITQYMELQQQRLRDQLPLVTHL